MTLFDWQEFYAQNKDTIICIEENKQETDCPITDMTFTPGQNPVPATDPQESSNETTNNNQVSPWKEYKYWELRGYSQGARLDNYEGLGFTIDQLKQIVIDN